jgi:hypothetical protein
MVAHNHEFTINPSIKEGMGEKTERRLVAPLCL